MVWRVAVVPGRLDQKPPGVGVAGARDVPAVLRLPGGASARRHPQPRHQLACVGEPGEVSDLGDQPQGGQRRDPAEAPSTRTWSAHRPSLARAVRLRGLPSALSVDLPRELELGVVEIRQTYVCPRQTESFGHAGAGESGQGQWGSVGLGRAVIVCLSSSPSKIRRRFVCEGFGRSHVSVRETELLRAA